MCDVRWCITVYYQQTENGNLANQIHGFTIDYSKFILIKIIISFSKLVRALWLVNLAGRTLPHGPLKFQVFFVPKLLCDLSPNFLNLYSK